MALKLVTLNPNDSGTGHTLTNGNLTDTVAVVSNIRATHGKTTGKWYWEVKIDSGNVAIVIGIANKLYPITGTLTTGTTGDALNYRAYYGLATKYPENIAYGTIFVVGDVVGVALDLDNGKLEFYRNGVSQGVSHTNLLGMGEVFPLFRSNNTASRTFTVNFGVTSFAYTIPSGFQPYAWEDINKILISSGDGGVKSVVKGKVNLENEIPSMTSNTTPSGIASASSNYGSGGETTYMPYRAFDGLGVNNAWLTSNSKTGWLAYEFPSPTKIVKYSILGRDSTLTWSPKDWTFEGSNDDVNWDILDTQNSISGWTINVYKEFNIENKKYYKKYRINASIDVGTYMSIGELKMHSTTENVLVDVPFPTENNFINHGISKPIELDLSAEISKRTFIEQSPITLGSGKVFKKTIDTTQVPIKKVTIK